MDLTDPISEAYDDIGLATVTKTNRVPKERLTSPARLRSLHVMMREDDRINAYNRGLCQSLLDGEPPFDQEGLNNNNQPDTTNLNFQGAEKRCERAKAPYYRLVNSGENLVSVKTLFGPVDERSEWEAVMGEEISSTIRGCDEFPYEVDRLIHKFVWEGVGIAYWQDDMDWRFKAAGLGQFYFPRQVAATESKQDVITAEEEYGIPDLYAKIDRPDEDLDGWDRDVVLQAIRHATNADPEWQNWERLIEEVKNNDLFVGTRLPKIRVITGYVKEFDGTVSHYIVPEVACNDDKFLFKKRHVYASMTQGAILFPYGTGTNTKLHGIRGLGYKVYPFEQQLNRSVCRLIDQGELASSFMMQPESETDYANAGLEYIGNLAIIPPGFKAVNVTLPDLQRTVIPAIEMMTQLGNERTAGYSPENIFDGDQRKTKFEVAAHLEQTAELSNAQLDFFYTPGDRLFQQIIRRLTYRKYLPIDPGGEELADLKLRLVRRGVPLEAFYRIDWKRTTMVRVIGAGSAAAKTLGLQRMGELRPRMDDVAQTTLDREIAIDAVGVAQADKFFPRDGQFRTTTDTQIAILQNDMLLRGIEAPVLSSDKHLAHAREHIKPLIEMYQAVEAGERELAEAATTNMLLFTHTVEHVQSIEGDASAVEEAAAMRQMLQRIEEVINNGLKEAEAMQEEAAVEGAAAAPEGPSPEQQERFAKAQAEIQIMNAKTAAAIQNEVERNQARIAMEDAKTAAAIQRENLKASAKPKANSKKS